MSSTNTTNKPTDASMNQSSSSSSVLSNYKFWLVSAILIVSIAFLIQHPNISNNEPIQNERLFTHDELKQYTKDELYLAILGHVFNVSSAPRFYSSTGSYKFYTGRDASRSFHTGGTSDEDLTDDLTGLDDEAVAEVYNWLTFYQKQYPYLGKLIGRYHDAHGQATQHFHDIFVSVNNVKKKEEEKLRLERIWPPCNSEWTQATGSRVWCTEKSGGVERTWVGVPRRYFDSVKKVERCVCVKNPNEENGHLKLYENCPSTSTECKILG